MSKFDSILDEALELAKKKGYLLQQDIDFFSNKYGLLLSEYDKFCGRLSSYGVSVYFDNQISDGVDLFNDEAISRYDYAEIYRRIIELNPSLAPFVKDVSNLPPPRKGEQKKLLRRFLNGDFSARKRLIEMNLRGAFRSALSRYDKYNGDIADLLGIACEALVNAINEYDYSKQTRLSGIVSARISTAFFREQPTFNALRIPPLFQIKDNYFVIYSFIRDSNCFNCRHFPKCDKLINKIQEQFDWQEKKIKKILEEFSPYISFEDFNSENELYVYLDKYADASCFFVGDISKDAIENIFYEHLSEDLKWAIRFLDLKMQRIVNAKYGLRTGEGKTLEEIGQDFGLSRERIRQIETKANEKLRIKLTIKGYKKEDIYNC